MKENLRLIVAVRRNRQTRGLEEFLAALKRATGLTLTSSDIVDPDSSVLAERLLASSIRQRLTDGSLSRTSELLWDEVQNHINSYRAIGSKARILLSLCHSEHFILFLDFYEFVKCAKLIIQFDGDTIYAISENFEHGIGIDIYMSELVNERRYAVDLW